MLHWIVRGVVALLLLGVAGFLHWSLPQRDVVRILGTEVARVSGEIENAAGETVSLTRDVRYIKTVRPNGATAVYRNEDTGWGWPPYFKFSSADLAAEADNAVSTEAEPTWHVITHYGWRLALISAFPNAVSIRPAEGPDETLIPWLNIVVLTLLAIAALAVRWRLLALMAWLLRRREAR